MNRLVILVAVIASAASANEGPKRLFEAKCATCHALPDPESLGEKQWQAVLKTMQKRMHEAGQPGLTQAEFQDILCFVSAGRNASCRVSSVR